MVDSITSKELIALHILSEGNARKDKPDVSKSMDACRSLEKERMAPEFRELDGSGVRAHFRALRSTSTEHRRYCQRC